MPEIKYNSYSIEPFELSGLNVLSNIDQRVVSIDETPNTFMPGKDSMEISFFTLGGIRLGTYPFTNLAFDNVGLVNDEGGSEVVKLDPISDHNFYGFTGQEVKILYSFINYPFLPLQAANDREAVEEDGEMFFIESISPDRKELRLLAPFASNTLREGVFTDSIEEIVAGIVTKFESQIVPDFFLGFGNNLFTHIVNIRYEEYQGGSAILIKLYDPLPNAVDNRTFVDIVEKVSEPVAFEIEVEIIADEIKTPKLRGANFTVELDTQSTEPSEYFNYNELFSFPTNNTNRELNSLFNEKGAELGIDYTEFSNFINFSSAEERLRNFKYKLDLIESYQTDLDTINNTVYSGAGNQGSVDFYENLLQGVINNFDHYERHIYYESGSSSWPKSTTTKPHINQIDTTETTTWYNAELQRAHLFDNKNVDILVNTVPMYLREDRNNEPYELFINMIGQHFDNLWTYTDAVSNKYSADNRLNIGVSKDIVEELLKNFGVKLYTSTKSVEDLFRYFTVNSYDTNGESLPGGIISSGQDPVSQNDYQKEIYKRIYHNLPLLMKSKGTERGLRSLINCFGIPSDVLKIKIYGGQSVNDLPYFGGEQPWTGSIDKIRLDNTGSIVEGNTVSHYTSILKGDNKYTQDLHRIEVGFSPSDNMDKYIIEQSAILFPDTPFNIDEYIGDPRGYISNIYPELLKYSKVIFENAEAYDLKDFTRLIKFFDNVVFRMIRDFVPARTVSDSGIIIKPHLLERYHTKSPVMTWTRPEYSGSIDTAFIESSDGGAYKNIGAPIANNNSNIHTRESNTNYIPYIQSPLGTVADKFQGAHQQAKVNGELQESNINVTDGELNRTNPFKNLEYSDVEYKVTFWLDVPDTSCILDTSSLDDLPINPQNPNINATAYNLASLFPGATGIYDYTVIFAGDINNEETITGPEIPVYDITNNGNYNQYDNIEVDVFHTEDPTSNNTCNNTRTIVLVNCDINALSGNIPVDFVPGVEYDLTSFWNSGTSPNTEVEYFVEGVEVPNPENFTIEEGLYSQGDLISVVVRDTFDPNNCSILIERPYNSCNLSYFTGEFSFIGSPPFTAYDPNQKYRFTGTIDNVTNYYARLIWDSREVVGQQEQGIYEADHFSNWQLLPPSPGTSTNPQQEEVLPIGPLNFILNNFGNLNNVETYTPHSDSDSFQQSNFESIQTLIDNADQQSRMLIKIQFKAVNGDECLVEQTGTDQYPYLHCPVIRSEPPPDPFYNDLLVIRNDVNLGTFANACCGSNNQGTYQIYVQGRNSMTDIFNNLVNNLPDRPIYRELFPADQGQQDNQGTPRYAADTGWYVDSEGRFAKWEADGPNSVTGQWTSTPLICDNVPGVYQCT